LIAQKFDGSNYRSYPGRPPVNKEIVELIVKMVRVAARQVTYQLADRSIEIYSTSAAQGRLPVFASGAVIY